MRNGRLVVSAIVLSLLQIGFLGWIIAGRAAILRHGTEVLLKIEPVDPRDLLRGDYVRLGYEISSIDARLVTNIPDDGYTAPGETMFVRLKKQDDGYWRAVSATLDAPGSGAAAKGEVDIKGTLLSRLNLREDITLRPDYGIERFYLPEGEGLELQKDMRERPFGIRLAIARDGTAQIKALVDGDKTLFEEAPY
jgi:uncharacterized membrane-anchored protein